MAEARRTVTFGSAVGMHARPAAAISAAVAESGHSVILTSDSGASADGASVLMLLAMGVNQGDEVTIVVAGDDAERVADSVAELVGSELDSGEGEGA